MFLREGRRVVTTANHIANSRSLRRWVASSSPRVMQHVRNEKGPRRWPRSFAEKICAVYSVQTLVVFMPVSASVLVL